MTERDRIDDRNAAFAYLNQLLADTSPTRRTQEQWAAIDRAREICDISKLKLEPKEN